MKYPWLDSYLSAKKAMTKDFKVEWQWTRYMIGNKMFAALCKDSSGQDELLTLKLEPLEGDMLRNTFEDILPGYYMNKVHWNSVKLEGAVPDAVVKDMIDKSYELVLKGLPKKLQKEIEGIGL